MSPVDRPETGPHTLSHLRVADLTSELGWLAGKLFADLGAQVVKVEAPGGDPGRRVGPFLQDRPDPNESLHWWAYNAGKRSLCLDLAHAAAAEVLRRLAAHCDVLFESFPPGYMATLGCGAADLLSLNPQLVIVSITPYGQDGPLAGYRGSDLTLTSMGGLTWLCGDADRAPTRIGVPQALVQAGMQAAVAAMLGHFRRQQTGRGVHVDLSAQEAITWGILPTRQDWEVGGVMIKRAGPHRQLGERRLRVIYACRDGYVAVFSVIGKELEALARWLDDEHIAHELHSPRWASLAAEGTRSATQADYDCLAELITTLVGRYTKDQLFAAAQRRGLIIYPVNGPLDLAQHECLLARQFFQDVETDSTPVRVPGEPFRMAAAPAAGRAARIGEHTDAVLAALGYDRAQIAALRRDGAVA